MSSGSDATPPHCREKCLKHNQDPTESSGQLDAPRHHVLMMLLVLMVVAVQLMLVALKPKVCPLWLVQQLGSLSPAFEMC